MFFLAWQGLSALIPPIILPSPLAALARLQSSFWDAPEMAYFGIAEPNFYANLVYTTEKRRRRRCDRRRARHCDRSCQRPLRHLPRRSGSDHDDGRDGADPRRCPFLLIWFGVGRASAVCLVIFYVTVMLYVFAQRAASNVNPIYEDFARTLGRAAARS